MYCIDNSLKKFNTFGLSVYSDKIFIIDHVYDLKKISQFYLRRKPILFLGRGSNILLANDFHGIVIINRIKGIKFYQDNDFWFLKINSGENWSDLVYYSIKNGFWGLENLSFIPGTVGGAVVNNIGSYGLEIKNFLYYVKIFDLFKNKFFYLNNKKCNFYYRNSIFKKNIYNRFIIIQICLKLNKLWSPCFIYKNLFKYFVDDNKNVKIEDIYNRIEILRKKRLPDFNELGNVGSFFENPFINLKKFHFLSKKYSFFLKKSNFHILNVNKIKISASLLIDICNLNGFCIGNASIYKKNSLVIVNNGDAVFNDIKLLYLYIVNKVLFKFDIFLKLEVKIINFFNINNYYKLIISN